ncbi:MAG: PDZ domain-containing protein [Oscillibacter sp.]|jgi:serine protease Do|nr:PDZ domain-containing protein [Oscillibacter sp.]
MGEREENGRLPGEIVEVYRAPRRSGGEGDPREVVEVYRQPDSREVVESYRRPLPARRGRKPAPHGAPAGRRRRSGLWKFVACVAFLVGITVAARWVAGDTPGLPGKGNAEITRLEEEKITIPPWPVGQEASLEVSREPGEPLTAQEVYRRLNPSVVTVNCQAGDGLYSVGTGVIFSEDGYIITNYHVIRGGKSCFVTLDTGAVLDVLYVAGDEESDLAVLKISDEVLDLREPLSVAPFGDSELLVVGDPVYAIGSPRRLQGTLTNGIISAINRDIEVEGRTMTLLQTNAALNSGNSGGPLINEQGRVIGINVAKFMSGRDSVEGLGFAIPTAQLERIINDLLEWGEVQPEPLLGVMVIAQERGLLVDSVNPGGAAEKAGVQAGDYITAAQGETVRTNQDLFRIRRRLYVGDELTLTLWRNGEVLEVTLELEEAAD